MELTLIEMILKSQLAIEEAALKALIERNSIYDKHKSEVERFSFYAQASRQFEVSARIEEIKNQLSKIQISII